MTVLAVCGNPLYAQESVSERQSVSLEEVMVTGSRIRRDEYTMTQPMQVVDQEQMLKRGFDNVAQALNEMPSFGIPGSNNVGPQGSQKNRDGQPVGQEFVNFFGLGSQRTLVVVDGKRMVSQASPGFDESGQQIDLNIIPKNIIERVETLTVGGAPIYGSDAIAGTVNIILKDDFEGFEVTAEGGISERGDAQEYQIGALAGGAFSDGRGNAVVSFQYTDIDSLGPQTRRLGVFRGATFVPKTFDGDQYVPDGYSEGLCPSNCQNLVMLTSGGIPLVRSVGFPMLSGSTPVPAPEGNLVFLADGSAARFAPDGTLVPLDFGQRVTNITSRGGNGDDLREYRPLRGGQERINIFGKVSYELGDNVEVFAQGLVSFQEMVTPFNQPANNSVFGFQESPIPLRLDNPFLRDAARAVIAANTDFDNDGAPDPNVDTNGDGIADTPGFYLNRFSRDIFGGAPDFYDQAVYSLRTGIEGKFDLASRRVDYELSWTFGRTKADTYGPGVIDPLFFSAIDAVRIDEGQAQQMNAAFRPFNSPKRFSGGDIVCRSTLNAALSGIPGVSPGVDNPASPIVSNEQIETQVIGCEPMNIFGDGAPSREAIEFVTANFNDSMELEQHDIIGSVSFDAFKMPWNDEMSALAVGFEHRRERGDVVPGGVTELGLSRMSPLQRIHGKFNVTEGFIEGLLPVITPDMEVSFVERVQLEGAARWIKNDIAGTDVTWTGGTRIQFNDSISLRGNFTSSVRAPSIGEAFGPVVGVRVNLVDPCDALQINSGSNPAVRRANCEAQFAAFEAASGEPIDVDPATPGVQTGLENFNSLTNRQTAPFLQEGNPNLENEKADAFTIGAVFTPAWLPNVQLAVDWVDIRIKDVISLVNTTALATTCFDDPDFEKFCDRLGRAPNFQMTTARQFLDNIGYRNLQAMMFSGSYAGSMDDFGLTGAGDFQIRTNYQYLNKFEESILGTGDDLRVRRGELSNPAHELNLSLDYALRDFGFSWQSVWIGNTVVSNNDPPNFRSPSRIPSSSIHHAGLSYQLTEKLGVRLAVTNVFDRKPRAVEEAALGQQSSIEPATFDVLGRRYRLSLTATF